MTPEELRTILRRLAGHLNHLRDEIHDQPLHAPRYSQTDSRKTHGGPKPPCNLTDIDYLIDTGAEQIIKGWATNLTQDTTAHGLPHGQPLAAWCAWLSRHRLLLLDQDWADDAVSELQELEQQLRHHIHPTDPHAIKLPDYATAQEIATAYNITARAVRKYCKDHSITAWKLEGVTHYDTRSFQHSRS